MFDIIKLSFFHAVLKCIFPKFKLSFSDFAVFKRLRKFKKSATVFSGFMLAQTLKETSIQRTFLKFQMTTTEKKYSLPTEDKKAQYLLGRILADGLSQNELNAAYDDVSKEYDQV